MPRTDEIQGPYTLDSYVRGYNDGFFAGTFRDPYVANTPENRGYKVGFEVGTQDGGYSSHGAVEYQKVQAKHEYLGMRRTEEGQFSYTEGRLIRPTPISMGDDVVVLNPKDMKASGQAHEDVRMTAFAEGEYDVNEDPVGAAQGLDRRQNEFAYWIDWVKEEFEYPSSWTERLAESAYEGYIAGVQEALNPEAPLVEPDPFVEPVYEPSDEFNIDEKREVMRQARRDAGLDPFGGELDG
jgi:hypothetical protein